MRNYDLNRDKRADEYTKTRKRSLKVSRAAERKARIEAGFFDGRFGERIVKNKRNDNDVCRKYRYTENED